MRNLLLAGTVAALVAHTTCARAEVYSYTGNNLDVFGTIGIDPNNPPPDVHYTPSDRLTFSFTTSDRAAGHVDPSTITEWSASDGVHIFDPSDAFLVGGGANFTLDANGNIAAWAFAVEIISFPTAILSPRAGLTRACSRYL